MADNYLEKRMEEYRAGRLTPRHSVKTVAAARKPGDLTLHYPELRVLVAGSGAGLLSAVCAAFRQVDAKVALCMAGSREGTRIAQLAGCRFYPFDPSEPGRLSVVAGDLDSRWGGVDVIVDLRGLSDDVEADCAERLAKLLCLHAHPDCDCVSLTELSF